MSAERRVRNRRGFACALAGTLIEGALWLRAMWSPSGEVRNERRLGQAAVFTAEPAGPARRQRLSTPEDSWAGADAREGCGTVRCKLVLVCELKGVAYDDRIRKLSS